MKKERIVVALGGNALGYDPADQKIACAQTAKDLASLIEAGYEVVIAHGNGPQVGLIKTAFEQSKNLPEMPLPECGAMSQGYIGFHLQSALQTELKRRGLSKEVVTVVTQIAVDEADPAFQNPTKPIGAFYTEFEAKKLEEQYGFTMVNDAKRGYRRVVASPQPKDILEKKVIESLVTEGHLVICAGGGGIPVHVKEEGIEGVAAVIDKDFASELLAELLDADFLMILTAVEKVAIRFGQHDEEGLSDLSVADAKRYAEAGEFGKGSMLPKVEAAMRFAESKPGRKALITSLEKALEGLEGKTGTRIHL